MLKATSAHVRGAPSSSGFVYSQEFAPENSEKLLTHGKLFCLIVSSLHRIEVIPEEVGREILNNIKNEYYENSGKAFNCLKLALERVSAKFALTWGEIEIVAGSYVGGVVYSAVWGRGEVLILRGGMLANVLKGREGLVSASGYPQDGDFLILATKDFVDKVPQYNLKENLKTNVFLDVPAKLSSFYSAESPLFGALIVSFGNEIFDEEILVSNPNQTKGDIFKPFKNIFSNLSWPFKKSIEDRQIYIRKRGFSDYEAGSKKTTLTVGIILIVLLLVSIIFGLRQRSIKNSKSRYETRLTQATHEFEESQNLFSIDKERSRELLLSSREIVSTLKSEGVKDSVLDDLASKIEQKEGEILGETRINLENFVDLSLVSSGFKGQDLASSGEEVFVLDPSLKRVIQVSLDTKRSETTAGADSVKDANQIVAYEDRSFVVNQDGVEELGDDGKINREWDGDVLAYSYAANIYVLEKSTSSIWRYSGSSSGFGSKQSWLGSGLTLDFTQAKSFAIDGSMWILDSGDVTKLTFGTVDTFNMTGLPGNLSGATNLYTNEEAENLYVLDPPNGRIVVFDKSSEFKVQYLSDELKKATDLVVNEQMRRIVVLVDGNLKSIDLH